MPSRGSVRGFGAVRVFRAARPRRFPAAGSRHRLRGRSVPRPLCERGHRGQRRWGQPRRAQGTGTAPPPAATPDPGPGPGPSPGRPERYVLPGRDVHPDSPLRHTAPLTRPWGPSRSRWAAVVTAPQQRPRGSSDMAASAKQPGRLPRSTLPALGRPAWPPQPDHAHRASAILGSRTATSA